MLMKGLCKCKMHVVGAVSACVVGGLWYGCTAEQSLNLGYSVVS